MFPKRDCEDMHYLIDGHNLIPKVGLSLNTPDDEAELLARLQRFCRLHRAHAEVYFDGAPPGQAGIRRLGLVTAHFVHQDLSADAAIEAHLIKLGARAREWTVVSSDRRIRRAAQEAHATLLTSEEFARQIAISVESKPKPVSSPKNDTPLSPQEVEEWLRIFEQRSHG